MRDISHGMTQKARNISVYFRVFPWQNRTEATHTSLKMDANFLTLNFNQVILHRFYFVIT